MTTTPWQVLETMTRRDASAPRLTFYDRSDEETRGERIELSAKVLTNWVSKGAGLLAEEFDVEFGTRVGIDLPAAHWRTAYWCLAAWSLGACVVFTDSDTDEVRDEAGFDVLVTNVPSPDFAGGQVVVTLEMLARGASVAVPAGALDDARELSTYPDHFEPFDVPSGSDVAWIRAGDEVTFRDLVSPSGSGAASESDDTGSSEAARHYLPAPDPAQMLRCWARGGSVVVVRGHAAPGELDALLAQEGVHAP